MVSYLYEYATPQYSNVKQIIDDIAKENGVEASLASSLRGIHSVIRLSKDNYYSSFLCEFPGNCSTLVIDGIEGMFTGDSSEFLSIMKTSIQISEKLSYAMLICSGTSEDMKKFLMDEMGFQIILDNVLNPHSGHKNFFLAKMLEVKEIK